MAIDAYTVTITVVDFVGTDKKYDVIFIDVDSKDLSQGLSSPPSSFVDSAFLSKNYIHCYLLEVICLL